MARPARRRTRRRASARMRPHTPPATVGPRARHRRSRRDNRPWPRQPPDSARSTDQHVTRRWCATADVRQNSAEVAAVLSVQLLSTTMTCQSTLGGTSISRKRSSVGPSSRQRFHVQMTTSIRMAHASRGRRLGIGPPSQAPGAHGQPRTNPRKTALQAPLASMRRGTTGSSRSCCR